MSLLPPASFGWLVAHEVRLGLRAMRRRSVTRIIGYVLLSLWLLISVAIGWSLRTVAIVPNGAIFTAVLVASLVVLSFMTTQGILGGQRTLYEAGDLDLMVSAPIAPRVVLMAKLVGIAANVILFYTVLIVPPVLALAVFGHPALLGAITLLMALALTGASIGIAITLVLARAIGPRAGRTVGQILAAVLGGSFFLVSQLGGQGGESRRSGAAAVFGWLRAHGWGTTGVSVLPGHAAFGDPAALAIVAGIALTLFVIVGITLERLFLSGYQTGGAVRAPVARATGSIGRYFAPTLARAVFAKEIRLLLRDPALLFQIVLRMVYLVPILLVALRNGGSAPGLAMFSVVLAVQLAGSFAGLTVSAEDAPDLLTVAPVPSGDVKSAKVNAALAMTLPFALPLPVFLATQTIAGGALTMACTLLGGLSAAMAEVRLGKPVARSAFARRRSGSILAGIVTLGITVVFAGAAGLGVWLLG